MISTDGRRYRATSERVTADAYQAREGDYLIYLFHLATYDFAIPYAADRRVLDFGCGTGYGAHRISPECGSITGVDVSASAIDFARDHYQAARLDFRHIAPVEQEPLPFADASFDVVLSFQVIEHVPDADRYLAEAARVLAPGGVLVVATPDRTTRLLRGQRPWNRYHLVEYSPAALNALLGRHFGEVELSGMGADPAIIGRELRRSRRVRWMMLPFTFPGAPEAWRQAGLAATKAVQARLRRRPATGKHSAGTGVEGVEGAAGGAGVEGAAGGAGVEPGPSSSSGAATSFGYDETAIRIAANVDPSANIVAVARKA
ncbi:class I SAM-dependent methyltransferase [Actinopolymorpha pittospori]